MYIDVKHVYRYTRMLQVHTYCMLKHVHIDVCVRRCSFIAFPLSLEPTLGARTSQFRAHDTNAPLYQWHSVVAKVHALSHECSGAILEGNRAQ